jgi:PAS domain S-box-containing protein
MRKVKDPATTQFVAAFVLLAVAIAVLVGLVYTHSAHNTKAGIQAQQRAMLDLLAEHILDWREGHLRDAAGLSTDGILLNTIDAWRHDTNSLDIQRQIVDWMENTCASRGYRRIALMDPQGRERLVFPRSDVPAGSDDQAAAAQALDRREVAFSDLHRIGKEGVIHVDLAVPLVRAVEAESVEVGALVLQVAAEDKLYPLIRNWPVFSPSGEILLVRREGDEVVLLNDRKRQGETALQTRLPVNMPGLPSGELFTKGKMFIDGRDSRGTPVIATARRINTTPWALVAKVDKREIYAPLRKGFLVSLGFALLLIGLTGVTILQLQRSKDAEHFKRLYRAEEERAAMAEKAAHIGARYRRLFENGVDAIFVNEILPEGMPGKFLDVNDVACSKLGYRREELLQMTVEDINVEDVGAPLSVIMPRVMEEGRIMFETCHRARDGRLIPVEISAHRVLLNDKMVGMSIVRDITQRKRSEASLAAEKERLAVTLRSIGDAVVATDEAGRITGMNPVAEDLTDWSEAQAVGRPLSEVLNIIDDQTGEPCDNPVEKTLQTGVTNIPAGQTLLISRAGREVVIEECAAPIKDREGHTIGVVLVFRDTTEKQKLEAKMANTEKLEALGMLAGGIAHDFNNLLSGIFGYIDLAGSNCESGNFAKTTAYLTKAMNAFDRAKDLTTQLLTFSKGGKPRKSPGNIGTTVRDAVKFALSGSNVRSAFAIAPDLWPCEYDPHQICQVVDNMVINAKHAMADGGLLEVGVANFLVQPGAGLALPAGDFVRIVIRDYGAGIAREHLPRVFDPFFTTKKTGSGLGLATSWSIVRRHDGTIDVESEPGKGTTFTIYLPASHHVVVRPAEPVDHKVSGQGHILVMDDEDFMREIIAEMLSGMGFSVQTACDGHEANFLFERAIEKKKKFDAVILDLTIPGDRGGKETAARIRTLDASVPIIAASGYSDNPILSMPRDYGFTASIRKPFQQAQLAETLVDVLKGTEAIGPAVGGERAQVCAADDSAALI